MILERKIYANMSKIKLNFKHKKKQINLNSNCNCKYQMKIHEKLKIMLSCLAKLRTY